ncbi:hypothetical protein [Sphingobium tyrosinilyticum]|uniref:Uncharacterized protein n=1 Tax=Sphingobium tyrosinilyticum TaxID=2715436 RepID=A0ABV9F1V0_9SPHN
MNMTSLADIRNAGFEGFVPIGSLLDRIKDVPQKSGVYLVIAPDDFVTEYLEAGSGGWFKGRDPNVALTVLTNAWIQGARVINIGKAGGPTSSSTLRKRLRQYMCFGQGQAIGHWGGRYIWQLRAASTLLIAWKITESDPRQVERELIAAFQKQYGARPFANLQN